METCFSSGSPCVCQWTCLISRLLRFVLLCALRAKINRPRSLEHRVS